MNIKQSVTAAENRIRRYIRETPLEYSFPLSESTGSNVFLKLENLQFTGSFKPRGAVNKLLTLSAEERARGVLTASTGNHGLAVAYGAQKLGIRSTIYLPENTSPQKLDMLQHYDVELRFHGSEFGEAELYAREESRRNGTVFVSAYNDEQVIAGQGTMAVELQRQMDHIDVVLVSVGGGGLIAGIAGHLKETNAETRIIGCLPENSPVMYDSIQAGRIVESQVLPTLSDGTSGGIEPEAITFGMCQRYVDDWMLVSEDEIRQAMKLVFEQHRMVIEGSAAVSVASLLKAKGPFKGNQDTNVALIICGGNVDIGQFKRLVF